ncbi:hypothetical protein CREGCYN_02260 [Synechococcus sp. M16CYN]
MPHNSPISAVTSCLKQFQTSELDGALKVCNEAIVSTPNQAELLRDRALVHILNGNYQEACSDVAAGLELIRGAVATVGSMLHYELEVRQATCEHSLTARSNN